MSVRLLKPTTNARRSASVSDFSHVDAHRPAKRLTGVKKRSGGRNNQGRRTAGDRGGGHKRQMRQLDFVQNKFDILGKVVSIEYDPNRSGRIALVQYADGERRYILAPARLSVGQQVIASKQRQEIVPGNRLPLELIPPGEMVSSVELVPGRGGVLGRSAGRGIMLQGIEGKYAQLKLPSTEIRLVPKECMATIGEVSNPDHRLVRLGKAGRSRWLGRRPHVRGKAKNPVDHPHGGGEGNAPIGLKRPKTPTGKPALGPRTRRTSLVSAPLILQPRKGRS